VAGTHGRSSFTISLEGAVDAPVSTSDLAFLSFAAPSPNPSRGPVTFSFALPRETAVRLTVHDVAGRVVRTLWEGPADGDRTVVWDRRDDAGQAAAAGVYFARLEAEGSIATKTVTLLR
jgi:hypothetical protein